MARPLLNYRVSTWDLELQEWAVEGIFLTRWQIRTKLRELRSIGYDSPSILVDLLDPDYPTYPGMKLGRVRGEDRILIARNLPGIDGMVSIIGPEATRVLSAPFREFRAS